MTRLGASPLTVPIFPDWRERAARLWGLLSASTHVSCSARVLIKRGPCSLQPLNYKKKNDVFSFTFWTAWLFSYTFRRSFVFLIFDSPLSLAEKGINKIDSRLPLPWETLTETCSPILWKKGGFRVDRVIERPRWMRAGSASTWPKTTGSLVHGWIFFDSC